MILFFDSGIGGLAYLQELRRRQELPSLYLADTGRFPYGERDPREVRTRVVQLVERVISEYSVEAAVIACNTASVVALEEVRNTVNIPVIGVVPAVKPAAEQTRSGHIAILSTNRTARDPYTDDLVARFARYCRVTRLGLPRLVTAAEESLCGPSFPSTEQIIREDVAGALDDDVDTVVLACTHFIGLRDEISGVLGPQRRIVDSLDGVTRRLLWTIQRKGITVSGAVGTLPLFLTTAPPTAGTSCLDMETRMMDPSTSGVSV
jgi:glutamate racemase